MQEQNSSTGFADAEQDLRDDLHCVLQAGILNELLRKQLTPSAQNQTTQITTQQNEKKPETVISTAVDAVTECLTQEDLDRESLHDKLSRLFYQQKAIFDQADIDPNLRARQYITHCGLIMSPNHCVTTVLDDLRVRSFIRGIDKAIKQKTEGRREALHIVYPACGPFAPLLLPLVCYYQDQKHYDPSQLQVTLIDVQPGAVLSLEALVTQMGVKQYIRQICCMDALQYEPGEYAVDMVVLEAMQHGFSREGQLLLARHFAQMLGPDGVFIPQKIVLSAVLNRAQREYVEQWQDADVLSESHMCKQIKAERTVLGDILSVTKESLLTLKERVLNEHTSLIECGQVDIPELPQHGDEQTLLICTQIETFDGELIGEYDSGITHPLPDQQVCINFTPKDDRPGDLLIHSGDAIRFYYRLNGLPGFMATWAQGESDEC